MAEQSNEFVSDHYGADYFSRQVPIGEFGGWANQAKFREYIDPEHEVLDFGCGGGFILKNLSCSRRVGVEVNPVAAEIARNNGIEVYASTDEMKDADVDRIISNHALEHSLRPLDELKKLHSKLRDDGRIIFIVPCEEIRWKYKPNDENNHLYTWSPMSFGNLFVEAGYDVIESKRLVDRWPPRWIAKKIIAVGGRPLFNVACYCYGRIPYRRISNQVRLIATKK